MLKWTPANVVLATALALVACAPVNSVSASSCVMESETLDTKTAGPLALEVFGSETLCIEATGDANLAQFVPTVRVRNTSADPITVQYQLDPARSFRSRAIWPAGSRNQSVDFSDAGGARTLEKSLGAGEELLVSSWTRHNDEIRNRVASAGAPQDYVVRFDLAITYDGGAGKVPVAESFEIPLRAVPVN